MSDVGEVAELSRMGFRASIQAVAWAARQGRVRSKP
jgi:hypothetical protein